MDALLRNGSLFWHIGIPEDEIWLKVGGDNGGRTFKMSFQSVNTQAPNSPANTCILSIFEAEYSVTNLKVVADRFGQDIKVIPESENKLEIRLAGPSFTIHEINSGKKIGVFLCGDYEFETRSCGLSGASGKDSYQAPPLNLQSEYVCIGYPLLLMESYPI